MGRECRRVPPGWEHPKNDSGNHVPLHDIHCPHLDLVQEWLDNARLWGAGEHPDQSQEWSKGSRDKPFWEWNGGPPDPCDYMPFWPDSERTHYQMYEDTSEGTPVSPVFDNPEDLARWLADTGASAFGGDTATIEWWRKAIDGTGFTGLMISVPAEGRLGDD